METYDIIVIGSGHNALIAAAYLTRLSELWGTPTTTFGESATPEDLRTLRLIAFLIEDAHQGRGIGQLLLEHLAEAARERGITRFVAEVLPENRRMAQVFADAGYRLKKGIEDGVLAVEFPILPTEEQWGDGMTDTYCIIGRADGTTLEGTLENAGAQAG